MASKHIIESLDQYVKIIDDFNLFYEFVLFRGQPIKGNLVPSVARTDPKRNTLKIETKVFEQLRLLGASLIDSKQSDLDLMVLAQHFGLKTRLLDWTQNALIALWFACESLSEDDSYVYVLEADDYLVKDAYSENPFSIRKTRAFQPRMNNPRVIAQSGWFTLHRYSEKTRRFVPLERNSEIKSNLTEIRISGSSKKQILDSLEMNGINYRTIYPDLAGLCMYLNSKHRL